MYEGCEINNYKKKYVHFFFPRLSNTRHILKTCSRNDQPHFSPTLISDKCIKAIYANVLQLQLSF